MDFDHVGQMKQSQSIFVLLCILALGMSYPSLRSEWKEPLLSSSEDNLWDFSTLEFVCVIPS